MDTIPTTFLVGKDGRIAWIGHPNELTDKMIDEVLAGKLNSSKTPATIPAAPGCPIEKK